MSVDYQARMQVVNILEELLGSGNVYDSRPMFEVGYPFANVSNTEIDSLATTTHFINPVLVEVDVFSLSMQEASTIAENLIQKLLDKNILLVDRLSNKLLVDKSTNEVLYHSRLLLPIYF